MCTKTRFACGAVLGLLSFAIPALQADAAEPAATAPFLLINSSTAELLTMQSALERALQVSPELTACAAESRARDAEISQAARFINPELTVEVANVAGSGAYSGFEAAETTLELSQQIELGGKRQLRRNRAQLEHDLAVHDLEVARIDLQARTARNFLLLLGAQERLKLAEEQKLLAAQTLAVVEEKIAAGRAPNVERYRFQSFLAEAGLVREKAMLALSMARQRLADNLAQEKAELSAVVGNLSLLPALPTLAEIEAQLDQSPEIVRRRLESEAHRRSLALTSAERIVDPTLSLGLINDNDSGDNALIFGLSLPLPFFDRHQGKIQAATERLAAAQAQEASTLIQSRAGLYESWQVLAANTAEAGVLREQLLPTAQRTFEAASYGYQSGKFGVLEVQDAQRHLVEVRARYLDVLIAAQLAAIELQQLLGRAPVATIDLSTKE